MSENQSLFEDPNDNEADPDEIPIKDRKVVTQPYDLVVDSLVDQIKANTIFLRPISERPDFQRRYVWPKNLASRLIESILLNVPIPPCYLSQNDEYELDVIDGQQRLFTIFRFVENQFPLSDLEVLKELNGLRFHELPLKQQRQIKTHTLRCTVITNESHPEIKFDVFERLNTNTVPLNAQELRNCIYRGPLNDLLKEVVGYEPWLSILGKKKTDPRMRDEELALRFFALTSQGVAGYRTPQKHWLNEFAKEGRGFSKKKINSLRSKWQLAIDNSLIWFEPNECFRREARGKSNVINRALFDLIMMYASKASNDMAIAIRNGLRTQFEILINDPEFSDLISRAVDHTKRTKRRFELWDNAMSKLAK
jgi:hypothetical protein